jgi:methylglutaconyl-CoA hydratase
MTVKPFSYVDRAPIGLLWLDRTLLSSANAGNHSRNLLATLGKIKSNSKIRALVLAFSDVSPAPKTKSTAIQGARARTHRPSEPWGNIARESLGLLESLPMPIFLRLHGENDIFGMALAAASDIVIASLDATFAGPAPQSQAGMQELVDLLASAIGKRHATRYLITGEPISAAEAFRIGLVHELAPVGELDSKINEILGHLVLRDADSPRLVKQALRSSVPTPHRSRFAKPAR